MIPTTVTAGKVIVLPFAVPQLYLMLRIAARQAKALRYVFRIGRLDSYVMPGDGYGAKPYGSAPAGLDNGQAFFVVE
ncbi:hypothetical protein GCM10023116_06550 [Kistimonas scapharcae]|uniref:Uncharacterized protein n=1 Tax=Kistimonas scapharcae TaxID=1036133 RepID=A0ABP8UWU2_9GAMM